MGCEATETKQDSGEVATCIEEKQKTRLGKRVHTMVARMAKKG